MGVLLDLIQIKPCLNDCTATITATKKTLLSVEEVAKQENDDDSLITDKWVCK
jgi:hypothetical protein